MLTWLFIVSYAAAIALSTCSLITGRMTPTRHNAVSAVLHAVFTVFCAVQDWHVASSIGAASTALSAWSWWHGGGGDGTRRRLKSWARRFQGVRRTAPQGA